MPSVTCSGFGGVTERAADPGRLDLGLRDGRDPEDRAQLEEGPRHGGIVEVDQPKAQVYDDPIHGHVLHAWRLMIEWRVVSSRP
jgi:hypothetical protein